MPPTSVLQAKYPLSPRKFWKKLIEKSFLLLIVAIFLTAPLLFIFISTAVGGVFELLISTALFSPFMWVGLIILYGWYVKVYIRRYYYDADNDFLTIKKGVFAPTEIHVQYQKIQDVYVDQDILDRIMGLYDVHIASATATSGIEAHIDGVERDNSEGLKELLLEKLRNPLSSGPSTGTPGAQGTAGMPQDPVNGLVVFSEEISSATYPITGAWVLQQAISTFFASLVFTFLIVTYLGVPDEESDKSIFQYFGLSSGEIFQYGFAIFCILYALLFIYQLIWRSTYSFQFLPEFLVMQKGVISRSKTHTPYRAVQDVVVSQSIIERMLGLAHVSIENAAAPKMVGKTLISSAIVIPGQPLAKANHLSDVVKSTVLTARPSQMGL